MPTRYRLDAELVRRKIARSREHARELIAAGRVHLRGIPATKAATSVTGDDSIRLVGDADDYVSRGAHKLIGALDAFAVDPSGLRVLDAGASTGGFTDVLLRRGAAEVLAVDVGYGQLAWKLQTDERVRVHDRTNVRHLTPDQLGGQVDLTVGDLSFISLELVLPALTACTRPTGLILPMVKPQFEVGKGQVGAGGVVADPAQRAGAVWHVVEAAARLGWTTTAVAASPLPGPKGNVEFFCRMQTDGEPVARDTVDAVVAAGPGGA
ncbi:23S rRNA (cytidine1920-2'-O)/16S rRNA (cytidine1409-2'-O)-methyltransferase [Glycomyces sambucus]|uniref:23S rRNA (Cytidine1920-2'-O)/16S rRNA (Cytidine1409-2'-O)-methyltransferase n=1 Tax=Glycomyces sambucus TaxID=380244 RepID=A0A1G9CJ49_9ACTN|nr:TlyA family RNA methyltransferase [Glycomyces sambucus]SDK51701.1 23S rRNA (cytidine1920-2'-O)/16S rRNA (cytidine1409-2'-O)-methyltransferase [Glycomyces sambucus]